MSTTTRGDVWTDFVTLRKRVDEFDGDPRPYHVTATVGLHKLAGNERPYWSLTGEYWPVGTRRENASGGACGERLIAVWPELALFEALHLSDDRGWPMHAEANALHWLGLTGKFEAIFEDQECNLDRHHYVKVREEWKAWEPWPTKRDIAARHLRVPVETVDEFYEYLKDEAQPSTPMTFLARGLHAQWQAEHDAASVALDALRTHPDREA